MDSVKAVSKRGKRPWAQSAGTRSVFRVQAPLRKTVECQRTHPYKLGRQQGGLACALFSRAGKDPAPEVLSQLWGGPLFCHSWPVIRVHVQPPPHTQPKGSGCSCIADGLRLFWVWGQLPLCKWYIYKSISSSSGRLCTSEHCFPRPRTWLVSGHEWMPPVYWSKTGSLAGSSA